MSRLIPSYIEQGLRIEMLERAVIASEGDVEQLERKLVATRAEVVRLKGEAESWEQVFDRTCEHLAEAKTALAETTVKDSLIAQRPWVGLTDEEITQNNRESLVDLQAWKEAVLWAEAKLREKNT